MARPQPLPRILTRDEAAVYCGYEAGSAAFDDFASAMGFRKVPGRKGCYDRFQIDAMLDSRMGLGKPRKSGDEVSDWFAQQGVNAA